MQNVMQIATNAGHTAQNDGRTTQNDGRNTLYVCQGPKGGHDVLPRAPTTPILKNLEMIFRTLGKKNKK